MNFFEQQDRARRNSTRLVLLMGLAVASLITITTALAGAILYYIQFGNPQSVRAYEENRSLADIATDILSWQLLGSIALCVSAIILLAGFYKLVQFSGGGRKVAESMGGRLINLSSRDSDEKKVLNVVEEMAIASGTPVPPVYLLDDASINAFAAGYKAQDAVIGVTRGCIQLLNRDELQGVIAHEFSHIFHGDMRLNLRLVGILHGILVIGLLGHLLLRSIYFSGSSHRSRSSNNGNSTLAIAGAGVALIIIGFAGTFFGNLIKAAVSRQREFLADASAVQFTRNPEGIAGALKKIGGLPAGSQVSASNASEFSHMYFSQGVNSAFNALMTTHPPLAERIKRLQPNWQEDFKSELNTTGHISPSSTSNTPNSHTSKLAQNPLSSFDGSAVNGSVFNKHAQPNTANKTTEALLTSAIEHIGSPRLEQIQAAQQILEAIPYTLNEAAHNSFSARAIIYGLLLDKDIQAAKKQQNILKDRAHPLTYKAFQKIAIQVQKLDHYLRLPLIELCMPALKELSAPQYKTFKQALILMIRADNKVNLFEWSLYRILIQNLEPSASPRGGRKRLQDCQRACEIIFAALAQSGGNSKSEQQSAFDSAIIISQHTQSQFQSETFKLGLLDWALQQLQQLRPLEKPKLLKAMLACIHHDGKISATEAELFRALADSLDCPVPAILPTTKNNG